MAEKLRVRLIIRTFAARKQCNGLSLACESMREESPGSIGRSTGESASCWRQQDTGEENNRPTFEIEEFRDETMKNAG